MLLATVLRTALDSLDNPDQRDEAQRLINEWHASSRSEWKGEPIEERVVFAAHAKILGSTVTLAKFEPVKKPVDRSLYERTALAWLTWAAGMGPSALLQALPKANEFGGAIHVMALEPWARATKALHEQDFEEARRLFRRSIELGTQYGTETNEVVQWAYVASFFHEPHRGT